MPSRAHRTGVPRPLVVLGAVLVLGACAAGAPAPPPDTGRAAIDPAVDQPSGPRSQPDAVVDPAGPHEVALVADLGPLPDGSGRAVVETTWTTDAAGTVRLAIDTPAGLTEQHVLTADAHWWWLHPEARRTVADAEWVHFDLVAIEEVGGELPDLVAAARQPPPQPEDIGVGDLVAGREVRAVEVVGPDEVHLTVDRIDEPVVLRRRALPPGERIRPPEGAVDVTDLPGLLRW